MIDTIFASALVVMIIAIVLVPWLSICDISKAIDRQTECLKGLINETHDIDREIHLIRNRIEKLMEGRDD